MTPEALRVQKIRIYAQRKFGGDYKAAEDWLIDFALTTLDARRKGGQQATSTPAQLKRLAKARASRASRKE